MNDDPRTTIGANAQRLLMLLDRLRPRMVSPAFQRLQELQLSPSHFGVLRILHDGQPVAMKDLAERMHITPPSITALTRRLVQTGMVERLPHPEDSRVTLLALTAEGRELFRQLHSAHLGRMGQLLAGLTPAEQTQFLDLFERAIRYADSEGDAEIGRTSEGPAVDPDAT